ncbi:MAG: hypothetical protein Ct9H300mP11_28790 [Chloroflexota bacterium]|nr:MAG: hypothetical protein Ct9H300mP11_28790 [Chloroflexota bacterium]
MPLDAVFFWGKPPPFAFLAGWAWNSRELPNVKLGPFFFLIQISPPKIVRALASTAKSLPPDGK